MRERLVALIRVGVGSIFVYAAATKLPDLAAFAEDLANYRLLPARLVPALASGVVGVELVAGLALVAGIGARGAALLLGGLLGAFVLALSQALLRGIDLRCGCFGGAERASWWTVARDAALLACAAAVAWRGPGRLGTGREPGTSTGARTTV